MNVTAVVELMQTLPQHVGLRRLRGGVAAAALGWTRSGLLANLLVSRADYGYAVAMLLALASEAEGFECADVDELASLYAGRVIGFSELPILTLRAITFHLGTAGIAARRDDDPIINIRNLIDKRVLRTRTDEYDVISLMMAGQLLSTSGADKSSWPCIFPQMLLTKAIRERDINWIAILAVLAQQLYGAPEPLMRASVHLLTGIAENEDLLPMPSNKLLYSEFFERSDVGLRLRSTLSCLIFLEGYVL